MFQEGVLGLVLPCIRKVPRWMKRYDPALAHPLKSECVQGFLVSVAFTENVMRERGDCLAPDSVCEVVFAFVVVAAL